MLLLYYAAKGYCDPPETQSRNSHAATHSGEIQDRDGAPLLLAEIFRRFLWLHHVFPDGGYTGDKLRHALLQIGQWGVAIVKRSDPARDFVVLFGRLVVERMLAWLNRNPFFAADLEKTIALTTARFCAASVQLRARRIARSGKSSRRESGSESRAREFAPRP